jgi:hypothetical protein
MNITATDSSIQSTNSARHSFPGGNATTDQHTEHGIELSSFNVTNTITAQPEIEQTNLPQADGGKDAHLFLCGCFMAEAMCWGELSP